MLTPLDIQNKEFKRVFSGYSMQEVDEFLNLVIDGYEKLYKENMDCKDRITKLEESVNQYKNIENTLQSTLIVAQSTSEQVVKNAEEKAANIIADANNKAKGIVADSFEEVKKLEYRYEEIKRGIDVYTAKMTALLESQLGLLKQAATSDKTLAEIRGMREALAEVEAVEEEINTAKAVVEEPVVETVEEPVLEVAEETIVLPVAEEVEPESVKEDTMDIDLLKEEKDGDLVHDFNTKEIEFLLNADK
ncbi:MAG: DivIVA domain-containing protein [Clostridia bacterium]|nr:DivIVA domain-containing protein [Clostridia bacterium]